MCIDFQETPERRNLILRNPFQETPEGVMRLLMRLRK